MRVDIIFKAGHIVGIVKWVRVHGGAADPLDPFKAPSVVLFEPDNATSPGDIARSSGNPGFIGVEHGAQVYAGDVSQIHIRSLFLRHIL